MDSYEFTALNERITVGDVAGTAGLVKPYPEDATDDMRAKIDEELQALVDSPYEYKPHFHEWWDHAACGPTPSPPPSH